MRCKLSAIIKQDNYIILKFSTEEMHIQTVKKTNTDEDNVGIQIFENLLNVHRENIMESNEIATILIPQEEWKHVKPLYTVGTYFDVILNKKGLVFKVSKNTEDNIIDSNHIVPFRQFP